MSSHGTGSYDRKPFFVYVDEFATLARDENFLQLLAEARKYGLGLILATQYLAQLNTEQGRRNTLSAILGNVGTIVSFRLGTEDAQQLEAVFAPEFDRADVINCPNWNGYMRLHLSQQVVPPFSFRGPDPLPDGDAGRADDLREASRATWAKPAVLCDQTIASRRKFIQSIKLVSA